MDQGFDTSSALQLFVAEARERLGRMSHALLALEARPDDLEAIRHMLHEAHTLKGAARMLGLTAIGTLAHRVEDVLLAVEEHAPPLSGETADLVFEALDALGGMVDGIGPNAPEPDLGPLLQRLEVAAGGRARPRQSAPAAPAEGPAPGPSAARPAEPAETSVRVSLEKLDQLANFAVEMLVSRMRAAEARRGLQEAVRLSRAGLKQWPALRDSVIQPSAGERAAELVRQAEAWNRDLRKVLERAWDELEEVRAEQGRLVTELRNQVMGIRMQPLSVVFEALPRAVRDLARGFGKDVQLLLTGGEVELDRRIIEELREPLLHLIRNALDHGLEAPSVRVAAGKPAKGLLVIRAWPAGNRVVVEVEDDGAGMDPAVLRETAVRRGHLDQQTAAVLSDAEALDLIFSPGFSTSRLITDVSGRGIGMEVVRKVVDRLRGYAGVDSVPGRGTRITLDLPLSLAMLPALLVRAGGIPYALPATAVERVARFRAEELSRLQGRRALSLEGETIPLVDLAALLGMARPAGAAEIGPAVVLRARASRVGFVVDEICEEVEVVQRELGAFLSRAEVAVGATVLGSGEVALILDPARLIRAAQGARTAPLNAPAVPPEEAARLLLVEDSLIARDLQRTILESAGYRVTVALDGMDALEKLRAEAYAAVVTDVEMPRMDGFELLAWIRAQEATRELPVVVVTSRERPEDRRRGLELGADAYILKSSFDQSSLLDTLRLLVGGASRVGG